MWLWVTDHPMIAFGILYVVVKVGVRLTPTNTDNAIFGLIEGAITDYWKRIPNLKRGGGKFEGK